ncbi:MAG: MBL fold metallo-hydrolase [Gammaproteobacteria bacterium]|nr:MBL fold metallo-hydrolase [Gammaproteobacteria bacterium]
MGRTAIRTAIGSILLYLFSTASLAGGARVPDKPSGEYDLPATAIDTDAIPAMVIDADAPDDEPLPYYRIAADTYMLFGNIAEVDEKNRGWNGNAGFVVTEDGVFVIDSLGTPKLGRRFLATIRSVTDQPVRYLLLTHNHPDHSYGAIAFRRNTDATVIAHKGTLDYIHSQQIDSSVEYRRGFIEQDMQNFAAVTPDVLIDDEHFSKKRFTLGDKRFVVYNSGKHHSHGDLVMQQLPQQILWISDLAFNQRTTFMGDGSSRQALESQQWLLQNFPEAKLMVPGHGSAQRAPFTMVSKTRSYVERLREEMGEAVEAGITLQQAVESSDFPDWHDTRLYQLNHRANANFVYREMELELF